MKFERTIERHTDCKFRGVRSDRDVEYLSDVLTSQFEDNGIHYQLTSAHTPHLN